MSQLAEAITGGAIESYTEDIKFGKQFSLIIPILMPDEFLLGYFGRFGLLNGHPNYTTAKRKINSIFTNHFHKEYQHPLALQFAHILNLDPEKIVANHTLVPILRSPDHKNIPSDDVKLLKAMGYSLAKPNVCFCENCLFEDLNLIGHSYWRRFHQIHGVDFCSKHRTPLLMAIDENAHYQSPYKIWKSGKFSKQSITPSEYDHPVIKKYIELTEDYLGTQTAINYMDLIRILDHRKLTNSIANPLIRHSFISDYIVDNTPNKWLVEHFPMFKIKVKNIPIFRIDFATDKIEQAPSLSNLLLMIANLMPEATIQILQYKNELFLNALPRRVTIGKSTAVHLYKKYGGNYSQISEELTKLKIGGMHFLYRLGLPPLDDFNDATLKAIFDFFDGTSMINIMQRKSVNFIALETVIRNSSPLKTNV
ncbi:MAG TPA: TniQ family protein [Methylotenera sp.]|nr:TniQ family protein [Methylotenera sp.]